MEEPRWFVTDRGRREGPLALGDLVLLLMQRDEPRKAMVWRKGLPEWVHAEEVAEIAQELPPSLPPVDNTESPAVLRTPPMGKQAESRSVGVLLSAESPMKNPRTGADGPAVQLEKIPLLRRQIVSKNVALFWAIGTVIFLPKTGLVALLSHPETLGVRHLLASAIDVSIAAAVNVVIFGALTTLLLRLRPVLAGTFLLAGFLALLFVGLWQRDKSAPSPIAPPRAAASEAPSEPWDHLLSTAEKGRLKALIMLAFQEPHPTDGERKEFWLLIDKAAGDPALRPQVEIGMRPERERLVSLIVVYQRLFWDDAQTALVSRVPYKSKERENYEKQLLRDEGITEWRIKENEQLIKRIAQRQPVRIGEAEVVVDAAFVEAVLSGLDATAKRVERLYTPP